MTVVLAAVAGAAIGSTATGLTLWRRLTIRGDQHNYRQLELAARNVRELWDAADTNYRTARRLGRALDVAEDTYRYLVADLLDQVAALQAQLRPGHMRRPRYAQFLRDYGSAA